MIEQNGATDHDEPTTLAKGTKAKEFSIYLFPRLSSNWIWDQISEYNYANIYLKNDSRLSVDCNICKWKSAIRKIHNLSFLCASIFCRILFLRINAFSNFNIFCINFRKWNIFRAWRTWTRWWNLYLKISFVKHILFLETTIVPASLS